MKQDVGGTASTKAQPMIEDRATTTSPKFPTSGASNRGFKWWAVLLSFLTLAAAALAIDIPIARLVTERRLPVDLRELLNATEAFGHGAGAACVICAIWVLDRRRRDRTFWILAASIGSGLAADGLKLCISRQRPTALTAASEGVTDTFGHIFPFLSGGSAWQGFPSAHTATAVGLAVALTALYPHGRWLFVMLAVLAALSRVAAGAHFLSDVLVGAAIGWVIGHWCVHSIAAKASAGQNHAQRLAPVDSAKSDRLAA